MSSLFRWFILFELIPTRIGKYISLDSFGFLGCYQRSDSRQSRFLRKERAVFATLNGDWASLIALFRPIAEDGCVHGRRLCKLVATNSIVQLYHWSSSASKVRGESQNITGRSLLEAAMTSFPYWAGNTFGERLMCPGSKCFIHPSSPSPRAFLWAFEGLMWTAKKRKVVIRATKMFSACRKFTFAGSWSLRSGSLSILWIRLSGDMSSASDEAHILANEAVQSGTWTYSISEKSDDVSGLAVLAAAINQ